MTSLSHLVNDASQVASARRSASSFAANLGFSEERAGQVALVVTELATNILKHAVRGELLLTECRAGASRGIEILSLDCAQGFHDIPASLADGRSTAGSLGHGLGSVRRQADDFQIYSQPGKGAAALARMWPVPTNAAVEEMAIGGVCVAKAGEHRSGDGWAARIAEHRGSVIVADGLGHGVLAAEASDAAIAVFDKAPLREPASVLEDVHLALRATRGAAVAVAAVEFERNIAIVAGIGNIAGAIVAGDARRNIVSHNGTAGHIARRFQEFTYPMLPGATLVMHSDGLIAHWNHEQYPGLWTQDPSLIAGVLYRDFTRRRDDVTVVVGRRPR
jgi:anti-sigma regulatory factor (Ser/Thr protein kinase)